MKIKKLIINTLVWGIIACFAIIMTWRLIDFVSTLNEISSMKFYPESAPSRTVNSAKDFSLSWSTKTEDGSQYLAYTQIFAPNSEDLIYVTVHSINSIEYSTGELLWSKEIPEDSTFHLYDGKIFSLDSYSDSFPFASYENIDIPSKCDSSDKSTLRVYDPHTGEVLWEYSYGMVFPEQIYFKDNSAFIHGLTINVFSKYISVFEIDIDSGKILGVECQNLNDYSRNSANDGILSSGFYPIARDWEWERETELPAFIIDGSNLVMVDRRTKKRLKEIEFSGYPLNPDAVQLIIRDNILVVYLDDSNQFFAFKIE